MAAPAFAAPSAGNFDPKTGRAVDILPGLVRVTAPNRGPYTFTGTNTFIVGHHTVALIDPGPDDVGHLAALNAAIGGRRVAQIILTHTHLDHSALAHRIARDTGAPVWAQGPHRLSRPRQPFEVNLLSGGCDWNLVPDRIITNGEILMAGDVELAAIATPGHCFNHMSFGLAGTGWLLTGDHIMGWNSTLVAVPDGSMADYLASLEKVIDSPWQHYLPAHGGAVVDGPAYARALLAHRHLRNSQIIDAVSKGSRTTGALLRAIYKGIAPALNVAARMTLEAHIEYLAARGEIVARRGPFGWRVSSRR